jgi:hypothetical protein
MLSRTKIILVLIVSYDWSRLNGVLAILTFVDHSLSLTISFLDHQPLLLILTTLILVASSCKLLNPRLSTWGWPSGLDQDTVVADAPHQHLSAGLLVPMQDWEFLCRCFGIGQTKYVRTHRTNRYFPWPSLDCSHTISFNSLIKSILVMLANPFFNPCSLNFFHTKSAHSSSSSCCAASLVWEKGLVHYCTIHLLGWTSALGETLPLQNSEAW